MLKYRSVKKLLLSLALLGLIFLAIAPIIKFKTSFFFYLMVWICMALSLNIIYGFTGYLPFGYVAFYGIGAYTAAILYTRFNTPMELGVLVGAGTGVLLALLFIPTLKLRGIYFAIVNLALSESLKIIIANCPEEITGGSFGISLAKAYNPLMSYYVMLGIMVASFITNWLLSKSKLGVALKAIKSNPDAAEAIGIDAARCRLYAWILASVYPAFIGGLDAWYTAVIDPASSFNPLITARSIAYPLAGGMGTIMGPVIGSILLYTIDDVIWSVFPLINLVILGLLIALLIGLIPDGVIGVLRRRYLYLREILF